MLSHLLFIECKWWTGKCLFSNLESFKCISWINLAMISCFARLQLYSCMIAPLVL